MMMLPIMMMIHDDVLDDDVLDDRDTEDGISPMMAAVGAGRLEVVRHLVNQHSDENMVGMRIMGVVMRTLRRSIRMMRMVR